MCISKILTLLGCIPMYNLNNFVIPDDKKFIEVINSLNTPEKICQYMQDDFVYQLNRGNNHSPYEMWLANTQGKGGDCADYSCFAVFVAHYHGYEVYQLRPFYYDGVSHMLGVFVVDGKYNYSNNQCYYPIQVDTFKEILKHHRTFSKELKKYKVYGYNMKIVKELAY